MAELTGDAEEERQELVLWLYAASPALLMADAHLLADAILSSQWLSDRLVQERLRGREEARTLVAFGQPEYGRPEGEAVELRTYGEGLVRRLIVPESRPHAVQDQRSNT